MCFAESYYWELQVEQDQSDIQHVFDRKAGNS
jgi:hypothetical protein